MELGQKRPLHKRYKVGRTSPGEEAAEECPFKKKEKKLRSNEGGGTAGGSSFKSSTTQN